MTSRAPCIVILGNIFKHGNDGHLHGIGPGIDSALHCKSEPDEQPVHGSLKLVSGEASIATYLGRPAPDELLGLAFHDPRRDCFHVRQCDFDTHYAVHRAKFLHVRELAADAVAARAQHLRDNLKREALFLRCVFGAAPGQVSFLAVCHPYIVVVAL